MATLIDYDELGFISLSTLLCIRQQQQDVPTRRAALTDAEADSSSDEDWDGYIKGGTATPQDTSCLDDKEQKLAQFLDHIAETFSREKSSPPLQVKRHERRHQRAKGRGAHHVAAAGLMMVPDQGAVVFIAKNGGMDAEDEALARLLTTWLNVIARTMTRPKERDRDAMWKKLVEYHRNRLDVYVEQIGASSSAEFEAAFSDESGATSVAHDLHDMAVIYMSERSINTLLTMIPLAYRLRYEPAPGTLSSWSRKARLATSFLGRLLAAYESFKEMAITFPRLFSSLALRCIPAPKPQPRVIRQQVVTQHIAKLSRDNNIPSPPRKKIASVLGQGDEVRCYCHAEVQVLLRLEGAEAPTADVLPYIGCSKRSCWLCHQLLSRYWGRRSLKKGFYQTRGSHGHIYPLWCVTQPAGAPFEPHVAFFLSSSLMEIRDLVFHRLRVLDPRQAREPVAESSANITTRGGRFKLRALAKQRLAETSEAPSDSKAEAESGSKADAELLKDYACSRGCFRFPSDGQIPQDICPIDFYRHPSGWPGPEPPGFCVPNFYEYWGMSNSDRVLYRFEMKGQEIEELNGDYILYWCRDSSLPVNKNLLSLIGIDSVGLGDHFWNGDVFVTRIEEDSLTLACDCQDVPKSFSDLKEPMRRFFQTLWAQKIPEDEVKRWQHHETGAEKRRADMELIRGRMTTAELKILEKMPGMLDIMVMSCCDDEPMADFSIRRHPTDRDKVAISWAQREPASETVGWRGFSSSDL